MAKADLRQASEWSGSAPYGRITNFCVAQIPDLFAEEPTPKSGTRFIQTKRHDACARSFVIVPMRILANGSGDPIVAGERPDTYAINYPELLARIEMAHRPLIEVNDAARP